MGVQTKRSSDDSMEELFALWLVEGPSSEESCLFVFLFVCLSALGLVRGTFNGNTAAGNTSKARQRTPPNSRATSFGDASSWRWVASSWRLVASSWRWVASGRGLVTRRDGRWSRRDGVCWRRKRRLDATNGRLDATKRCRDATNILFRI